MRAFENESVIIRPPDVVKAPPVLSNKFENYPATIIGENVNCVLIILWNICWRSLVYGPICSRKYIIELRVLRESKTFLELASAEIPKNEWQPQSATIIEPL